ncbi:MAG: hypothetical protein WD772_03810, partial [Pseudohongiellaceae bacterium]
AMQRRSLLTISAAIALVIAGSAATRDSAYPTPRTSWGDPDLQGTWRNATVMPFERPVELGLRANYAEEEALDLERIAQQAIEEDNEPLDPARPAPKAEALPPVGNYDLFWTDRGMFLPTIDGEFRTSAITNPSNGRVPPVTEDYRRRLENERGQPRPGSFDGPEGRALGERCLLSFGYNSGPVMQPVMYNSHYQIVQSPGYVVILVEMVHDARIIKLADEHTKSAEALDKWMGDSIGRWEGDTLVVETRFFNPWQEFRRAPVENLTVIETFRRDSENKIIYGFTVDDPSVYTSQFSGEYAFSRMDEPVYEYACHEGNYALPGTLAGARRLESEQGQ